jgi:hypothetical protein
LPIFITGVAAFLAVLASAIPKKEPPAAPKQAEPPARSSGHHPDEF